MNGKMKGMVEGILLGLCSKGSFQIAEIFTGLASGLEYLFDQNTLRLDIVDSGAAGDSFSMVGDTLTINLQMIAPTQTVAVDIDNEVWTDLTFDEFKELCESGDLAIVEYNDTTYECMMQVRLDSGEMVEVYVIGNAVLAPDRVGGHGITDTGEPFVLTWMQGERLPILQCTHETCSICAYVSDKPMIDFTIWGVEFTAVEGTTWAEWIGDERTITMPDQSDVWLRLFVAEDGIYGEDFDGMPFGPFGYYTSFDEWVPIKGADAIMDGVHYI